MLRRSSLVECVSVLHGTCLQCAEKKYIHLYVKPCEEKHIFNHKEHASLAYYNLHIFELCKKNQRVFFLANRKFTSCGNMKIMFRLFEKCKLYSLNFHEMGPICSHQRKITLLQMCEKHIILEIWKCTNGLFETRPVSLWNFILSFYSIIKMINTVKKTRNKS